MTTADEPRSTPPGRTLHLRWLLAVAAPLVALVVGVSAVYAATTPPAPGATTTTPGAAPAGADPATAVAADAAAATQAADPPAGVPTAKAPLPATSPAPALAPILPKAPEPAAALIPPDNKNCTLIVPANPLTAAGLATPYQLVATDPTAGPCDESNLSQAAFVQAAILGPNGRLSLYNPLIVTQGQAPAAPPVPAFVPRGATVGIWFGANGDSLTLASAPGTDALTQGACVNGIADSIFGQFAFCNAPAFFQAANRSVAARQLRIPRIGTARDGRACPTVRDFSVVDQDQSDNVNTHYLATADGSMAQPGAADGLTGTDMANGSDNRLLTEFVLPTLGCRSFTRPDQSNHGKLTASLPLQELQAAAYQQPPVALVPLGDPMAVDSGQSSPPKTNLYRAGVDQPALGASGSDNGDPVAYCRNIFDGDAGVRRVFAARTIYAQGPSPSPAGATNLFTLLASRASATWDNLGCETLLGHPNPIHLVTAGVVVTEATIDGATTQPGGGGTTTTSPGATTTPGPTTTVPGATTTTPGPTTTAPGPPTTVPSGSTSSVAPGPPTTTGPATTTTLPPDTTTTTRRHHWWHWR